MYQALFNYYGQLWSIYSMALHFLLALIDLLQHVLCPIEHISMHKDVIVFTNFAYVLYNLYHIK